MTNPQTNGLPSQLTPLAALSDNYIWALRKGDHAIVVDPGEAGPVTAWLDQNHLTLDAILLTHHHGDHVGGVIALRERTGAVVHGPATERLPACDQPHRQSDSITLQNLDISLSVLDLPGHTAGHIGYFGHIDGQIPVVFCGDTLFSAGCGRLFEGTSEQMVESLGKLAALPPDTLVCGAHEYTLSNLRWALQVEPGNAALQARDRQVQALRAQGLASLPSTIGDELAFNPFLRLSQQPVIDAARRHGSEPLIDAVEVFACLRAWKNNF